jgi:hypothetical protein
MFSPSQNNKTIHERPYARAILDFSDKFFCKEGYLCLLFSLSTGDRKVSREPLPTQEDDHQ